MGTPNNIFNYLMENYEAIDSIPTLVARLEAIETQLARLNEGDLSDEFDQGDHDELFADGGATERSFDQIDWTELHEEPNI